MDKAALQAIAQEMTDSVKTFVDAATAAVVSRVKRLEERELIPGVKGDKGDPGESIRGERGERGPAPDPENLKESIAAEVGRAVKALPAPQAGTPGKDGDKGDPGEPGKTPEPSELWAAFEGNFRQLALSLVEALPKPKDGTPGAPGRDGVAPSQESIALMISEVVEKSVAKIPRARDGADGQHGRDAAQIEPIPEIDAKRSYPRGTFADHRNGVVRALRQTDPLDGLTLERAGWTVCMNGIADIDISMADDGRTMNAKIVSTNGRELVKSFAIPTMQYRGIWREGAYLKGDVVTWDGSSWHAEADSAAGKPGESKDWKLMVKRGQNGKDLRPDEPKAKLQVAVK